MLLISGGLTLLLWFCVPGPILAANHLDFYPELTRSINVSKLSQSLKWLQGLSPAYRPPILLCKWKALLHLWASPAHNNRYSDSYLLLWVQIWVDRKMSENQSIKHLPRVWSHQNYYPFEPVFPSWTIVNHSDDEIWLGLFQNTYEQLCPLNWGMKFGYYVLCLLVRCWAGDIFAESGTKNKQFLCPTNQELRPMVES